MSSNSQGDVMESGTLEMFDCLPRAVRQAIAGARFDWAIEGWFRDWCDGITSTPRLVEQIKAVDAIASAAERPTVWGSDYPILKGELPHANNRKAA